MDPAFLDEILEVTGYTFAENLKVLYQQVETFSIYWKVNEVKLGAEIAAEDVSFLNGGIHLVDPFQMIKGPGGRNWETLIWSADSPDIQKNFRPIDQPSNEMMAGLIIEDQHFTDNIHLYYANDNEVRKTDLSLDGYLDLLISTKGFFYWQDFLDGDDSSPEYQRFIRYMSLLFPDFQSPFSR